MTSTYIGHWHLVGRHFERGRSQAYCGTCGDWWPLDPDGPHPDLNLHDRFEESREEILTPNGCYERVCRDADVAREYFECVAARLGRAVWLEVSFRELSDSLGIDFGDVSGSFSIVSNEILVEPSSKYFRERLNRSGLFSTTSDLEEYLQARVAFEEEIGLEYIPELEAMWVRVVHASRSDT